MVSSGQVRRREQRARDAQTMTAAAARLREGAQSGFAGLDEASGTALAGLLEEVAAARADPTAASPRVWDHALRVSHRFLEPDRGGYQVRPLVSGPAPAGHRGAEIDRTDHPVTE